MKKRDLISATTGIMMAFTAITPAFALEADKTSAVIFSYQRVGEDTSVGGNLSLEEFDEHIKELKSGGYNVLPVPEIIQALRKAKPLPPNTVGITFEGPFRVTMENVLPILNTAKIPYTLFLTPDRIDSQSANVLGWTELKNLTKNKNISFGVTPAAYVHMTGEDAPTNESYINRAMSRVREEISVKPDLFAYPFGEFDSNVKKLMEKYDFIGAFGQQSGVAYQGSDFLTIPRFVMTEPFGDIDRFKLTARALPLPVTDVTPDNTTLAKNPPDIGFTITPDLGDIDTLSCFATEVGKVDFEKLAGNRIEIRLKEPFTDSKARVNCTMATPSSEPGIRDTWRWLGFLFVGKDGVDPQTSPTQDTMDEGFSSEN